jgi:hypothetical protein
MTSLWSPCRDRHCRLHRLLANLAVLGSCTIGVREPHRVPRTPLRMTVGLESPALAVVPACVAHSKAVEPTPAAGYSPDGELARAADAQG